MALEEGIVITCTRAANSHCIYRRLLPLVVNDVAARPHSQLVFVDTLQSVVIVDELTVAAATFRKLLIETLPSELYVIVVLVCRNSFTTASVWVLVLYHLARLRFSF